MSNINTLLQNDGGVESLNEWQVKDVWCRMMMAQKASRSYLDDLNVIEDRLFQYHSGYLKDVAIRVFGKDSNTASALCWEDDPRNIERLFDEWTQEPDADDVSTVEVARERIKTTLRGCGMARMKVARKRVQFHTDNE